MFGSGFGPGGGLPARCPRGSQGHGAHTRTHTHTPRGTGHRGARDTPGPPGPVPARVMERGVARHGVWKQTVLSGSRIKRFLAAMILNDYDCGS